MEFHVIPQYHDDKVLVLVPKGVNPSYLDLKFVPFIGEEVLSKNKNNTLTLVDDIKDVVNMVSSRCQNVNLVTINEILCFLTLVQVR